MDFFICPSTGPATELHAWRDLELAQDYDLDDVYYDISSGNPFYWSRCLRAEYGHTPGVRREIIEAYEKMNHGSKEIVEEAVGRYFVLGGRDHR